tara:strand:+ start:3396 stop:3620 length:225 start_codon:yes stop_codon:yes gene_type:complete
MNITKHILKQWKQPQDWKVAYEDDAIQVCDEEQDFVVSSMTKNHVKEAIDDHLRNVKTAATMELLLSMSEEFDT